MGARYSLSGDSRAVTNLTVDTSSVNITLSVKSWIKQQRCASWASNWGRTKLQNSKHSSYRKQLKSHTSTRAKCLAAKSKLTKKYKKRQKMFGMAAR